MPVVPENDTLFLQKMQEIERDVQRNEIRGCGAELGEGIEAGKRDDISGA